MEARRRAHADPSQRIDDVGLFTRTLDDVTARLPEVVDYVSGLPARRASSPTARRSRSRRTGDRFRSRSPPLASDLATPAAGQARTPLTLFLFDALHVDGVDLLDEPTAERHRILSDVVPAANRPDRIVTVESRRGKPIPQHNVGRGHEGVMAKSLTAPYEAGRRGSGWLKVKPVHTLDLVVLAVEWGSGRRRGWLSNIHLGARDPVTGGFVMLGKTFKGMTDEMLAWQTERFLQLASGPTDGWVVPLRPEQVVEIAFDGVQRSSRYPGRVGSSFRPRSALPRRQTSARRPTPSMPSGRSPRSDDYGTRTVASAGLRAKTAPTPSDQWMSPGSGSRSDAGGRGRRSQTRRLPSV